MARWAQLAGLVGTGNQLQLANLGVPNLERLLLFDAQRATDAGGVQAAGAPVVGPAATAPIAAAAATATGAPNATVAAGAQQPLPTRTQCLPGPCATGWLEKWLRQKPSQSTLQATAARWGLGRKNYKGQRSEIGLEGPDNRMTAASMTGPDATKLLLWAARK
eukprot:4891197-Prymnesium_polylepis.1